MQLLFEKCKNTGGAGSNAAQLISKLK